MRVHYSYNGAKNSHHSSEPSCKSSGWEVLVNIYKSNFCSRALPSENSEGDVFPPQTWKQRLYIFDALPCIVVFSQLKDNKMSVGVTLQKHIHNVSNFRFNTCKLFLFSVVLLATSTVKAVGFWLSLAQQVSQFLTLHQLVPIRTATISRGRLIVMPQLPNIVFSTVSSHVITALVIRMPLEMEQLSWVTEMSGTVSWSRVQESSIHNNICPHHILVLPCRRCGIWFADCYQLLLTRLEYRLRMCTDGINYHRYFISLPGLTVSTIYFAMFNNYSENTSGNEKLRKLSPSVNISF